MEQITESQNKGITGSTLKWIAILSMIIDHTAAILLEWPLFKDTSASPFITAHSQQFSVLYMIMRGIGRLAFPLFCYLLVEGFGHTRSVGRYALRLGIFALLSEIPFDLALHKCLFEYSQKNNVFFTLLIGLLCIWAMDSINKSGKIKNASLLMLLNILLMAAGGAVAEYLLHTDYGAAGVIVILIFYVLKENKKETPFALSVLVLGLLEGSIEFAALLGVLPLHFYNGKRGQKLKYFFYAFYPLHLLLLAGIWYLLFGR